jgi:hypothetical protein
MRVITISEVLTAPNIGAMRAIITLMMKAVRISEKLVSLH